jgi:hypothetical protein
MCVEATMAGPIRVDSDGQFVGVGVISRTSWGGWVGTSARVSGSIKADTLTIRFERKDANGQWPSLPTVTTLIRGKKVEWSGYCLV